MRSMQIQQRWAVRWASRIGAAVLLVAAAAGTRADGDDARLPVPDPAARATAVAELKKELGDKLRSKDADVKRKLAQSLLDRPGAAAGDPVQRYVLLEQAATLAEEAHDVRTALDAVDRIAGAFQVARAARGFAAVDAIARGAKEPGLLAEAASACIDIAGDAVDADDAVTAGKAITAAKSHAKTAKLGGLGARAAEVAEVVGAFRKAAAAAEAARTTLAATPEDPAAHEALGRFLCFGRARWDEGFGHLAKSANMALGDVASRELLHSEDAAARHALADLWWDLAQRERDALARSRMLARAASIYETVPVPADADAKRAALVKGRLDTITYWAWNRTVAITKDFSKDGPASFALATIRAFIAQQKIDRGASDWRTKLPRFPAIAFSRGETYLWHLDTNQGAITIRFFSDTAPNHVANFLYLTELGFFDGLSFHRVIPGFMAQGGCPKGNGTGDPGYTFDGEYPPEPRHDKAGVLSMANTGEPKSDGSQFFITFRATSELDGKHTVFGEVVEGANVVKKLEDQGTAGGPPKTPLVINSARVSVK